MPTPLQRIQVLCEPNLYAAIKTIAKGRNKTLSATAAEMLNELLVTEEYKGEYLEAAEKFGAVPVIPDPRVRAKAQPFYVNYPKIERSLRDQQEDEAESLTSETEQPVSPEEVSQLFGKTVGWNQADHKKAVEAGVPYEYAKPMEKRPLTAKDVEEVAEGLGIDLAEMSIQEKLEFLTTIKTTGLI